MVLSAHAAVMNADRAERSARAFLGIERHGSLAFTGEGYYIFNFNPGFVVISADDRIGGVLGFSEDGHFETEGAPEEMMHFLSQYGNAIHEAQTLPEYAQMQGVGIQSIKAGNVVVKPLLTSKWAQTKYYNNMCPEDAAGNGGHALVGCGALVMGQVMRYWQFPTSGRGSYTYHCDFSPWGYGNYGDLTADFENTVYDYANMPDKLSSKSSETEVNAVATLLYHCGVACQMAYGPNASTAQSGNMVSAMKRYFCYPDSIVYIEKKNYSNEEWLSILQGELNDRAPFMYGASGSYGGHVFMCDGYRDDNYFHLVWGWGGSYDAYFIIGDFTPGPYDFNNNHSAIIKIRGPQLPASVTETCPGPEVTLFPNPVSDHLTVTSAEGIQALRIYALDGTLILTIDDDLSNLDVDLRNVNSLTMSLGDLPSGSYILHITTPRTVTTRTFIKQ